MKAQIHETRLEMPAELTQTAALLKWGSFEVAREADVELAGAALVEIEGRLKAIKAKQTELFGPLKKAIREFEARTRDDLTNPLQIVADTLRRRIGSFWSKRRAELEAEARRKHEAQLAEEKRKREEAMKLAVITGSDEALAAADQRRKNVARLEAKQPEVSQTVGHTAEMRIWCWRLVDPKKVPAKYLIIDEKALNKLAKGYNKQPVEIPGVEFYQESRVTLKA